ncbi:MAG: hypothetical protein AAF400_01510 [Bacteroidota bacterium]
MKPNFLIILLLLAGVGIKAKACSVTDSNLIKFVSETSEQIHLASRSLSQSSLWSGFRAQERGYSR